MLPDFEAKAQSEDITLAISTAPQLLAAVACEAMTYMVIPANFS